MEFLKHHTLIIIGAVVVLAIAVWWGLSSSSSAPAPVLTTGNPVPGTLQTTAVVPTAPADQDIVATLLTLRAVKLDGTIFADPAFMALRDFSTQIIPEPAGRPNPFAPIPKQTPTASPSPSPASLPR